MWLFTRYGFYSVACAQNPDRSISPDTLMIRARRASHLLNLQKQFPSLGGAPITELPQRDYRYRLLVPKETWIGVLSEMAREQDWSNFKAEADRYQGARGSEYVHALHDVWSVMHSLQD